MKIPADNRPGFLSPKRIIRDPLVMALVVLVALLMVVYLFPILPEDILEVHGSYYSELSLLLFTIGVLAHRGLKSGPGQERKFWYLFALAYGFYLCTYLLYLPENWKHYWSPELSFTEDTFNVLFYTTIYLAFVTRPHLGNLRDANQKRYRLEQARARVFVYGD